MRRRWPGLVCMGLMAALLGACGSSTASVTVKSSDNCVVGLHGKGGRGYPTEQRDGYAQLSPTGNADGWDGKQWLYFPADRYAEAVAVVASAADEAGCTEVVLHGFSNGAAFAGSLYCHGETLGGRLRGVIVDDPVPDHGADGCAPPAGVPVAVYWTGALTEAVPGADCGPIDWTCDGGSMVGIDAYAAALGTTVLASPFHEHQAIPDPTEPAMWLGLSG